MTEVVFRADGGTRIGSGHLMRCLVLASELRERDVTSTFVTRAHTGHFIDLIESVGFEVLALPGSSVVDVAADEDYAAWLGAPQREDAEATAAILKGRRPSWLVADHYGIGREWEGHAQRIGAKLMVVDDLADREHVCDLLLDQNYFSSRTVNRYQRLVSEHCRLLLGPRYALLRPEYAAMGAALLPRTGAVRRVFVFFGASDPTDETGKVLAALSMPELRHISVDLVIGANYSKPAQLQAAATARGGVVIHQQLSSLAGLMARADLAVGAGGTTTWERLCLQLPSIVAAVAAHQVPYCQALADDGHLLFVGQTPTSVDVYRKALDAQLPENASETARLVDGFGAARVADVLHPRRSNRLASQRTVGGRRAKGPSSSAAVEYLCLRANGVPIAEAELTSEGAITAARWQLDPEYASAAWDQLIVGELLRRIVRLKSRSFLRLQDTAAGGAAVVFLSDARSWINPHIDGIAAELLAIGHRVYWAHDESAVPDADICFLLGWERLVSDSFRGRFHHVLVVHESDVPHGRGMSPLTWQIIEGRNEIVVSLLEAESEVDAGAVYAQRRLHFSGNELLDELRNAQAIATRELCLEAATAFAAHQLTGRPQSGEPSWYPRRTPIDSRMDPDQNISSQFNLLRVVDNTRYPAYFEYRGRRFMLTITAEDRE